MPRPGRRSLAGHVLDVADESTHALELMTQLNTDDLGWRFDFTSEQLTHFFAELSDHLVSP
jgi:hypothetical protein